MNIKGILRKRIASMILAGTMSGSILGFLPINVNASEVVTNIEMNSEKTLTSDMFETQEEAKEWIENNVETLSELNMIIDAKLCLYKGYHKETETFNVDEIYENYSDVLNRIEEIGNATYFNCELQIDELKNVRSVVKTKEEFKIFNSIQEVNEYKRNLQAKENLSINIIELDNIKNNENIFKYGILNQQENIIKSKEDIEIENKCRIINKLNNDNPTGKYLLRAIYNEEVEEVSISYKLKGTATKTIYEDRYYAQIMYKPYSIKLNNEGLEYENDIVNLDNFGYNSKVKVKKL